MNEQIIIAGFGGQGALSMGRMLAEAAMVEGREVTWLPSYGPEMRGGTTNVSVIVSDSPIGAPTISNGKATCVIAMNRPSMEKFEPHLKPGGLLLVNSSIVDVKASREDIDVYYIAANDAAAALGNEKAANMVMLGAYLEIRKTLAPETLIAQLAYAFGEDREHLVDLNRAAIAAGADAVRG